MYIALKSREALLQLDFLLDVCKHVLSSLTLKPDTYLTAGRGSSSAGLLALGSQTSQTCEELSDPEISFRPYSEGKHFLQVL